MLKDIKPPVCCRCLKIAPFENKTGLKFCSQECFQAIKAAFSNFDDNQEDITDVLKSYQQKCYNCKGYHHSSDTLSCPKPKRERSSFFTIG